MPKTWALVVVLLSSLGAAIALGAIIYRRLWSKWPFTTAYLACMIVAHIVLRFNPPAHPWFQFVASWLWNLLSAILRTSMILDVIDSFPGLDFISRTVRLVVGSFCLFVAAIAAYISVGSGSVFADEPAIIFMHVVSITDRALCMGGLAFMAAALLALKPFGWSRRGAWMAHGIFWMLSASLLASIILTLFVAPSRLLGASIAAGCALLAQGLWCFALSQPEEIFEISPEFSNALLRLFKTPVEKVGS